MFFPRLILVIVLLIGFSFPDYLFAQELDTLNLQFEEASTNIESMPYFGLGGGFIGTFSFINFDEINKLNKEKGLENFGSPFFVSGAEGFTAIPFIENLRIGFFGISGTTHKDINKDTFTIGSRAIIQFSGFRVDYGLIPTKSLAILVGGNIGWSNLTLELYKTKKVLDWSNIPNFDKDLDNNFLRINRTSWFIEPGLNVEFAATTFLMIRFGASYSFSFNANWKGNEIADVENVPAKLNTDGLQLKIGLFVGLFNY